MRIKDRCQERGFAILVVLWGLVLLSLIATQMASEGREKSVTASNVRVRARLEAAAEAGLEWACFNLSARDRIHFGKGDSLHAMSFENISVKLKISPEDGKVNPNFAEKRLLLSLLTVLGSDEKIAEKIAGLIVEHVTGIKSMPNSARNTTTQTGMFFSDLSEVAAVIGNSNGVFDLLRPHLSIFAQEVPVYKYASPIVQQSMRQAGYANVETVEDSKTETAMAEISAAMEHKLGALRLEAVFKIDAEGPTSPCRILSWHSVL